MRTDNTSSENLIMAMSLGCESSAVITPNELSLSQFANACPHFQSLSLSSLQTLLLVVLCLQGSSQQLLQTNPPDVNFSLKEYSPRFFQLPSILSHLQALHLSLSFHFSWPSPDSRNKVSGSLCWGDYTSPFPCSGPVCACLRPAPLVSFSAPFTFRSVSFWTINVVLTLYYPMGSSDFEFSQH